MGQWDLIYQIIKANLDQHLVCIIILVILAIL